MRNSLRAVATACLVLIPSAASLAQTGSSSAYVVDYKIGAASCYTGAPVTVSGSSNAYCSVPVSGGAGFASSSSNNATRSISSATTLQQYGSGGSMSGYAAAYSEQFNSIMLSGQARSGTDLVFHFDVYRAYGFLNYAPGTLQSFYQLYVTASSQTSSEYGVDTPYGSSFNTFGNVVQTSSGADMRLGAGGASGRYDYQFEDFVQTYHVDDQYSGAYGSSVFNVTLSGIDAYDANGNYIASAVFDATGNATLAVAPEPATLTLFGSGFTVLAGISLRRRRRA